MVKRVFLGLRVDSFRLGMFFRVEGLVGGVFRVGGLVEGVLLDWINVLVAAPLLPFLF